MIKVFRKIKYFAVFCFDFVIGVVVCLAMIVINIVVFIILLIFLNHKKKEKNKNSMVIKWVFKEIYKTKKAQAKNKPVYVAYRN